MKESKARQFVRIRKMESQYAELLSRRETYLMECISDVERAEKAHGRLVEGLQVVGSNEISPTDD